MNWSSDLGQARRFRIAPTKARRWCSKQACKRVCGRVSPWCRYSLGECRQGQATRLRPVVKRRVARFVDLRSITLSARKSLARVPAQCSKSRPGPFRQPSPIGPPSPRGHPLRCTSLKHRPLATTGLCRDGTPRRERVTPVTNLGATIARSFRGVASPRRDSLPSAGPATDRAAPR